LKAIKDLPPPATAPKTADRQSGRREA